MHEVPIAPSYNVLRTHQYASLYLLPCIFSMNQLQGRHPAIHIIMQPPGNYCLATDGMNMDFIVNLGNVQTKLVSRYIYFH